MAETPNVNTTTGEVKQKRKRGEGPGVPPRPAYIVYRMSNDGSDFEIVSTSRNAEEVLTAVDADRDLKYKRTLIK